MIKGTEYLVRSFLNYLYLDSYEQYYKTKNGPMSLEYNNEILKSNTIVLKRKRAAYSPGLVIFDENLHFV